MWRDALPILGWRAVAAATSFVSNVLISRVLIAEFGVDNYAAMSIVLALPALLPFADLGMGGAIINAGADLRSSDRASEARLRLAASQRILGFTSLILIVAGLVILATGSWPTLLGPAVANTDQIAIGATIVTTAVGLGVLTSVATRLLQAWRRNALLVAVSAVVPPVILAVIWASVSVGTSAGLIAAAAAVVTFISSLSFWWIASREYPGSLIRDLTARAVPRSAYRYVLSIGVSGLVVSLGSILAFQSDRLLLSFLSVPEELATYSVVAPLYAASFGTLTPVAINLLPKYRSMMESGTMTATELLRGAGGLGGIAALAAIAIVALGPLVVTLIAGDELSPPSALYWAFGALLVIQGIQMPATMLLSSRTGFVVQRNAAVTMATLKLALAFVLIPSLGALGAVLGSVIAVALIQLPITFIWAYRSMRDSGPVES